MLANSRGVCACVQIAGECVHVSVKAHIPRWFCFGAEELASFC